MATWRTMFLLTAMVVPGPVPACDPDTDPATAFLRAVAADIEALAASHPPLADFRAATHFDAAAQRIDYAFRTHPPAGSGGWTAAVPNPDADGLWFHLDVHDPASTAQIHTQPMTEPLCLGPRRVSLLVLEGAATPPVAGLLRASLERHGVRRCE